MRKYGILLYMQLKMFHDIDIIASDIDIGASYGQAYVWLNYILIGPYHTNIRGLQVQVLVWVNDCNVDQITLPVAAVVSPNLLLQ